ncbi:S9 family peptidase [Kordiimonas aquimaris]|uniref:S9 family peptidase n=1 Tax=Kordiimonas aquimaris TaxID=707591 RepID=UPI0021D28EFF|nr:S9 family peptidase [Kordiimonas aquimaris]
MSKAPKDITPPIAKCVTHRFSHHGDTVEDPYHWLKDPGYPEVTNGDVLAYLNAENSYYDSVTKKDNAATETIFNEIKGRLKEDEEGVPWQDGPYDLRWAFKTGTQYRCWYYRPRCATAFDDKPWRILLDENQAAEGLDFFKLGALSISPDGRYLATSADINGSERFTITIKDLNTGEVLVDGIEETSGEVVWAADSNRFYYVKVSLEWRPYLVIGQSLSGKTSNVYEEQDNSFFVHISATTSKEYLIIRSADHVTAENHILSLSNANDKPNCICPRRIKHDYSIDHAGDRFMVRSNKNHINYSVFTCSKSTDENSWVEQLKGDNHRYLRGLQAFDTFTAVEDRIDGLDQITLLFNDGSHVNIPMQEPVYEVGLDNNPEANQQFIRLGFSSLLTPPTVMDVPVSVAGNTSKPIVRKVQDIPSGYDSTKYKSERLMVPARDGTLVPVSLVYAADWQKNEGKPVHLYGYGAYGIGMSPGFSAARLSLLDRGFAYAIAHIRGGDELGQGWYEAGKLEMRTNTFNDFVDVARHLTNEGYASSGGISISGGSAGGELMGAVLNQAPTLFKAAVLHVPFVDVLNTMLDAELPLTPIEWPEWGNPIEDAAAYNNIKSYCPYTNIEAKAYPPMLVTGGLNDPRVTYWEPAKWTAKMRATKSDDNLLIMRINMGAGHGGKSGRFERYREVAEEYMFLLNCFNTAP